MSKMVCFPANMYAPVMMCIYLKELDYLHTPVPVVELRNVLTCELNLAVQILYLRCFAQFEEV